MHPLYNIYKQIIAGKTKRVSFTLTLQFALLVIGLVLDFPLTNKNKCHNISKRNDSNIVGFIFTEQSILQAVQIIK